MSTKDPAYGCGSCAPCALAHAEAACSAGACVIASCHAGWADCDTSSADGCEADITAPAHCGSCGTACPSGQVCASGACAAACTPPDTNCGGTCASLVSSASHCGSCTTSCPASGNAIPACNAGSCAVLTCPAGQTLCSNHCVDTSTDPNNCGACGKVCPSPGNGHPSCSAGSCAPCDPGFTLCGSSCVDTQFDASNCGTCGNWCGNFGFCSLGVCNPNQTFATGSNIQGVAVDDTYVYWVDAGDGSVRRQLKSGGSPDVLTTGQAGPTRIVVDGSSIYWTNNLGGAVMLMPLAGGTPAVLAPAGEPRGIAADATYVYWTNQADSTVQRVPKVGGSPQVVATVVEEPLSVVVDANYVFFNTQPGGAGSCLVGKLYRAPKTGGAASLVATGDPCIDPEVTSIAINDTQVFWVESDMFGAVFGGLKTGSGGNWIGALQATAAADELAADDCNIYYPSGSGLAGLLVRQPIQGGAAVKTGRAGWSLAMDATNVYSAAGSTLYKAPR